jgi:hypothetical protein
LIELFTIRRSKTETWQALYGRVVPQPAGLTPRLHVRPLASIAGISAQELFHQNKSREHAGSKAQCVPTAACRTTRLIESAATLRAKGSVTGCCRVAPRRLKSSAIG